MSENLPEINEMDQQEKNQKSYIEEVKNQSSDNELIKSDFGYEPPNITYSNEDQTMEA